MFRHKATYGKGGPLVPVEDAHGEKHVIVMQSGKVGVIGLCEREAGRQSRSFWIESEAGYDQGEALPFERLYEQIEAIRAALLAAQIGLPETTALAMAMLAIDSVSGAYANFNAHDFHEAVLALAPLVFWRRDPGDGLTWACDEHGSQYQVRVKPPACSTPQGDALWPANVSGDKTDSEIAFEQKEAR